MSLVIPPGENRWLLADFHMDRGGAREGGRARLSFAMADGNVAEASIRIAPYAFDLPEAPSAATAFGTALNELKTAHERITGLRVDPESLGDLAADYLRTLADHRIETWAPPVPVGWNPAGEPGERIDWEAYDSGIGSWLDGTLAPDLKPFPYARPPSPPYALPPGELKAFEAEVESHFSERGWSDRLLYYEFDEPYLSEYGGFARATAAARLRHPGARTILTEPYQPELDGLVDIWCPDIPTLGDTVSLLPILTRGQGLRPEWHRSPPPEVYRSLRSRGKDAWLYTCMSASLLDYPDLFIDSPAAAARVIPWLMFRRGFDGLLYYNSMYSYAGDRDPWRDQYQFRTNGDGNLLYPLGPDRSASGNHESAPSLRMKLLREGLEDYEYLAAYEAVAGSEAAIAASDAVASTGLSWVRAIRDIGRRRDALGAFLDGHASTSASATTGAVARGENVERGMGASPAPEWSAAVEPGLAAARSEGGPVPASGAESAFNLWLPGAALDLWLPLSGSNAAYAGGALRFDLVYVVDPTSPGSLGRLRWERYLEFDILLPCAGGDPIVLLLAGMNGSFERGGGTGRDFLIPYAGLEAGLAIGSGRSAFAALPLVGCSILSRSDFSLSLETRFLATNLGSGFLGLGALRLVSVFSF
jgi:hypothetical protein